jgi:hypothetical protein
MAHEMPDLLPLRHPLALARTGADDARPSHNPNLLTNLHGRLAGEAPND